MGEGYYLINGNSVGRVQTSKASGRRYAVSLDAHTGRWTYATGLIFKITEADKLTLQQAMEYGKVTGRCAICGRTLTVAESIERGIGPVCAARKRDA